MTAPMPYAEHLLRELNGFWITSALEPLLMIKASLASSRSPATISSPQLFWSKLAGKDGLIQQLQTANSTEIYNYCKKSSSLCIASTLLEKS